MRSNRGAEMLAAVEEANRPVNVVIEMMEEEADKKL